MRATLVYNPNAGSAPPAAELTSALDAMGWTVTRQLSRAEAGECATKDTDVVVAAGGDGTISAVARALAGTDIPMAVVPMGTANNVARTLGLGVDPKIALAGLVRVRERRIDLGLVRSRAGTEYFLEGFGLGIFAFVIGEKKASKEHKKLRNALSRIADELVTYAPSRYELEADDRDVSGHYVLAAVMNGKSFGPAIALAPDARVDDAELDLVLIRPEAKEAFRAHLERASKEGDLALPAFETRRVKKVVVRANGRWAHADDRARQLEGEVLIEIAPGAVTVLTPTP